MLHRQNKKLRIITIIFLIIGASCLITFKIIGAKVLPSGELIEPFALLPIGFFLLLVGLILATISAISNLNKK